MRLYHGTSSRFADAVLRDGLRPRNRRKANHAEVPSHPRFVYMTDAYAIKYAQHAVERYGGQPFVVEIDTAALDPGNLNADEDAVEQTTRGRDGLPEVWSVEQRVRHYQKTLGRTVYNWEESVRALGMCAHRGPVPPTAFTRAARIDGKVQRILIWNACDANMTVMGHRFAGKQHRAALAWVFDGENIPEDVRPADLGGDENTHPRLRWEFFWPPDRTRDGLEVTDLRSATG